MNTAQKRLRDCEGSIELGLHMNDGPIDDSLSAHSYQKLQSPSQVRLAHRHHDCKTSVSIPSAANDFCLMVANAHNLFV